MNLKNSFKEKGYFIYKNFFDKNIIDNIINDIIQILKKYLDNKNINYNIKLESIDLIYDMLDNLYKIDKELYFSFTRQNGILSNLYNIKKLFSNEKVQEIYNDLNFKNISIPVTPQINLYCNFAVDKDYRNGKIGLDAHQDWPQTRGSLNNFIIWIAFTNINKNNAPILYVENSNKEGFIDGNCNSHNIVIDKYEETDYTPIELNKGDAIIFNGWLVHKTSEFLDNEKIRFAVAIRVNDLDDKYFIENLYHTSYETKMNRKKDQTRIPTIDEINNSLN